MSYFGHLEELPADPIFGLIQQYLADPREKKVNLSAGVYRSEEGKPWIFPVVKEVEKEILEGETSKDYLSIDGSKPYIDLTKELVFGEGVSPSIYGAETVGGTAALHVGGALLRKAGAKRIYLSNPTWGNHATIFAAAGLEVKTYPYFSRETSSFLREEFFAALHEMEEGSVVLLQGCCHNPTGFDPSFDEWEEIAGIMRKRSLFPFFDFAYQGFGVGVNEDAASIRRFLEKDLSFLVAVSHSKNFGLYAERAGAVYAVSSSPDEAKAVGSQIRRIIRGIYSNPPCHGARIVEHILGNPERRREWEAQLQGIRERIRQMRQGFVEALSARSISCEFLNQQLGMFSYTGLQKNQVERLREEFGIYLLGDGRINVAGLNDQNLEYVANAIQETGGILYAAGSL
ncbi:MAG: Aspartate aminotransferase [Chlamydiae bacterium]|nr:Aspartate aminotransferase [Chlamydiota bacterium]